MERVKRGDESVLEKARLLLTEPSAALVVNFLCSIINVAHLLIDVDLGC